ncbi:helix-turn-helix transcriptional regulator [Microbacterium sp. A84]|uniref:helix-turn-helix transcriptional regulator n=1 Tax=Microbacterium sp. A84 TaxID=3450715 RepID=UPI003F43785C
MPELVRSDIDVTDPSAVRAVLATGDIVDIVEMVDLMWYRLPGDYSVELLAALRRFSEDELLSRPRLAVAGMYAHQICFGESDATMQALLEKLVVLGSQYRAVLATTEDLYEVIASGAAAIIIPRLRGRLSESKEVGDFVASRIERMSSSGALGWGNESSRYRPGSVDVQRGLTATLMGDFRTAVRLYTRAYAQAGPPPFEHFAGANAASNLAMLAAIQGQHRLAAEWIKKSTSTADVPQPIEYLIGVGRLIATAMVAIDLLDQAAATKALQLVGAASTGIELWPFVASTHAAFHLAFGTPHRGLVLLEEAAFAHGHDLWSSTIADGILRRAHLDLLIAVGEGHRVVSALKDVPVPLRLRVPLATAYLSAGRYSRALRIAADGLRRMTLSGRDAADLRVISAVAQVALGRTDAARSSYQMLVESGVFDHRVDLIARLPQQDGERLIEALGIQSSSHVRLRFASAPVTLVELTGKESEVLSALARGHTPMQIAANTNTSLNTVRTHVKGIYRKLGASSRAEALAIAASQELITSCV